MIERYHCAWTSRRLAVLCALACCLAASTGCGTTRRSDTPRSATEQMLISDAIDRSVGDLDFQALSGEEVFFDTSYVADVVDSKYLVSSIRQHLLANGCILRDERDDATYVVEARVGTIGTDSSDLMFGIPAVQIPSFPGLPVGVPASLPEVALARKTNQLAVSKLAVFAYNRETGRPVWQSGISRVRSTARNSWIMGAGPFQRGTIYDGTRFAGDDIEIPLITSNGDTGSGRAVVPITDEVVFDQQAPFPAQGPAPPPTPSGEAAAGPAIVRLPPPREPRGPHVQSNSSATVAPRTVRGPSPRNRGR